MSRRRSGSGSSGPPDACKRPEPAWPKYPVDQIGKRLTPDELQNAVVHGDRDKASREGQHAIDKLGWLRSDEQRDRPDRAEREQSLTETIVLTLEYTRQDIEAGRGSREGGEKGARIAHGEPQERKERFDRMQAAIEEAALLYPTENFRQLATRVSRDLNCHERTIRRHTLNPRLRGK